MRQAVQQATEPETGKEGILKHLSQVKDLVSGANTLLGLTKGIDWAMDKIREIL